MAEGWTQLCRFFRNGYCREGSNCRFSHNPLQEQRVCQFYQRGYCRFGKNCWWSHSDPNNSLRARSNTPDDRRKTGPARSHESTRGRDDSRSETSDYHPRSVDRHDASSSRNRAGSTAPSTSSVDRGSGLRNGRDSRHGAGGSSRRTVEPQDDVDENCCGGRNCHCVNRDKCNFRNRIVFGRGKHKAEDGRMKKPMMLPVSKWKDKICGICMEVILEKTVEEQRFGILPNCNHCFCLVCIRKWRKAKHFENEVIRACPECRVTSDYVCPSKVWFENTEEKEKLLDDYKHVLSTKNCKYFSKDRKCPFGNKCFYLHALPDGTKVDLGPPKRHPRYLKDLEHIIMFEFLEENGFLLDMDIDIPMFLTSDSDEDSDRDDLAFIDFLVD